MAWIVVALLGFFGIVWLLKVLGRPAADDAARSRNQSATVMPLLMIGLAAAVALTALGVQFGNNGKRAAASNPGSDYARQAAKREAMKGGTVKDAHWSADGSFWITLIDDGTRRDGYAQAVCQIVRDAGVRGPVTVTAWEAFAMNRGEFKELGKARCR